MKLEADIIELYEKQLRVEILKLCFALNNNVDQQEIIYRASRVAIAFEKLEESKK